MDYLAEAKRILFEAIYLTLATVSEDGQPWNTPVYGAPDEQYNFFWTSTPDAQHSKNIKVNDRAFVVIYDSTQKEGTGVGVYLRGRAAEMNDPEAMNRARNIFYQRKHKPVKPATDFLDQSPRRLYQFVPKQCWMNLYEKVRGFGVDGRIEVKLW